MHHWTISIAICLLTSLSCATTALQAVRSSPTRAFITAASTSTAKFSITQVKNPNWKPYSLSTTDVYAAPFLKHKKPMPAPLRAAWNQSRLRGKSYQGSLAARNDGQLVNGSDGLYVYLTKIGTPAQNLHLGFDTGAGDFWVWSWLLPAYMLENRIYYNGSNSTSASQWSGQSFGVSYGLGSTYGLVWQDTVWVDSIGVSGNPIECIQNIAEFFVSTLTAVDGFLGLSNAYNDSESPVPQQTWMSYVMPHLAEPVFTASLVQDGPGTMEFGFINSSRYTGNISYSPVTIIPGSGGGFWAFNWTGFAIGSEKFNYTNIQVMTDTGGTIVNLPRSIAQNYFAQVNGSTVASDGTWSFPCTSQLPSFTFGVGKSGRMVVPGKHMVFGPLSDGVRCLAALQEVDESQYVYMTLPFLQALFVVHDYGAMQMGFANRPPTMEN
ncbi:acid protease [Hyaloscypha variabilis]